MYGAPFEHFYCPMLMKDEPAELILGHVVNEKFEDVPEFKITQRKDIDGWYGSMFEADFLNLVRFQERTVHDENLFEGKPPPALKPVITVGGEPLDYYHLKDPDNTPINEHTLMEINRKNGEFLRIALKKTAEEVMALQNLKWQTEVFADCRIAAVVSVIKAAYLTLFWKLGYRYVLSTAGLSIGRELLGRFYLENRGRSRQQVQAAAAEYFRPYFNMVRPAEPTGEHAPRGTIEDNRVFIWLGSSGLGLGIGVFVRVNKRLNCVLMPAYAEHERAQVYMDFLRNDKHELWVRDGVFDEQKDQWEANPRRVPVLWPKLDPSFDLSLTPKEILGVTDIP
jgi:hypothetical protein